MTMDLQRSHVFNIREFGAKGNGESLDTASVQSAIDACHKAGGGVVYCQPGGYLIGSIELKSNVTLYLEGGAKLLASTVRAHYQPVDIHGFPGNELNYIREHMIWARNAHNVGIAGCGAVDGSGDRFFGEPGWMDSNFRKIKDWRPMQLVAFIDCQDVTLQGVTFQNAPGWTIWPVGCERVLIHGIRILNDRQGPNTDGIDPDCCQGVIISDCHFDVGDDCIAVKSGTEKFPTVRACEDIVVTNCVMKTPCCAIRIGFEGDGPIRNCSFSNLVMTETRTGIAVMVPRVPELLINHGTPIENISFSNITMDLVCPLFFHVGDDAVSPGMIRNVSLANIRGYARRASYVGGSRTIPIEGLRLSGIDLSVSGEMDDEFAHEVPYPYRVWDYYNKKGIPHALYLRHVRDLAMADVRLRWGQTQGPWRSALKIEESEGIRMMNLSASGCDGSPSAPAVHLNQVQRATMTGCQALPGTGPFLRVEGERSEGISLMHSDLSASRGVDVCGNVPAAVVFQTGNQE